MHLYNQLKDMLRLGQRKYGPEVGPRCYLLKVMFGLLSK
jgi:hypothetical protein